ncbi:STE20-like serine/threonine-protein kinase [Saccostrea echinata]|uniref:STE20-like serine/threonine-protein kinase n=1 Tax=Saccostrea echinata TaxID=191078 RepID=UPI002A7FD057|nr:STE20-like serine/threonine-protein kinase [Saccostrea echinata]
MRWTIMFLSGLLFTSSQYIYLNEKDNSNSNENKMENFQTIRSQQIKLLCEVDELRQDNKKIKDLLTNCSSIAKELNALKTKDQKLEQDNIKLQQELDAIYNRIIDNQNLTLANIQRLNESKIYFLRKQLLALRRENEELKSGNSKIKERLRVDVSTLWNETFALKQQYDTLSKEKEALESKLYQLEKEIKAMNTDDRLKMVENRFWNFSHFVDKALDDIRSDQNATKIKLLNVSSTIQSD